MEKKLKTRSFLSVISIAFLLVACAPKNSPTEVITLEPVIAVATESMGQTTTPNVETPSKLATTEVASATTAPLPSGNVVEVEISGFEFESNRITIKVGDTVTWTNHDSASHSVVADDGSFKSSSLKNDASFSQIFDTPGTYSYHCGFHSSMTGTVIVEP